MCDHNIDRLVDALQRLTIEVQLFREAFVANNTSICESCSNNPCNKKAMLGDRRILECTMYDRKTENSSEIPNNSTISKMEQVEDKPKTQMKTQNSNLTFEKRTMRDCYNCKRYETEGECIECHYEPKDEPQTERSE